MLNSNQRNIFIKLSHALFFIALLSLYSCLPSTTPSSVNSGNSTDNENNSGSTLYPEPTYPLSGVFIQEGTTRTNSNVSLPINFNDSFMVRGLALSQYLRTIPVTTKICLVGRYGHNNNKDNVLILAAKPRAYNDLVNKTTEFYLYVEPANDASNQNDCLVANLTNQLKATSSKAPADVVFSFSFTQLCSNCTSSVTSSGLKLYFVNGEEVPNLNFTSLLLTLSKNTDPSTNQCSESTLCQAQGYTCCLEGQCVKEGAKRPSADDLPGFASAQADVAANPSRFILYPQFYFVCGTSGGSTGGTTGGSGTSPDYEAAIRLQELNQLYNCINKTSGEFSYCTLKYTGAHAKIPGDFSAAESGYFDDINFSSVNPNITGDYANNIVKVIYAGNTLYEQGVSTTPDGFTFLTNPSHDANDDLTTAQGINVTKALPTNAQDSNLYITYKVDGTCEKISSSLAKCSKTYIQTSNVADKYLSTWHDSTKSYKLPSYAKVSENPNIIVKINGSVIGEDASTWSKNGSANSIDFNPSYPIYQNQVIEITYYVNSNVDALTKLRSLAQASVNSMCTCASTEKCNLTPIRDSSTGALTNFECFYPSNSSTEPPANQTVYVSAKNTPHRYYDSEGVNYDENTSGATPQEVSAGGANFTYTNNNLLKPSNLSIYTGFNEIYGSYSSTGTYLAKPAKMVRVKKSTKYDIFVNTGSFSSCVNCGTDYYNSLQKVFPSNFNTFGGGYVPDKYESSRQNATGAYRADDLLYGRACFVPATMIPWTHVVAGTPRDQRRSRLAAQHFLFANGYQRDWYGFDYGSIIGSFDGVTWFSVGNQRRITASGTKLYLAVNAYYGDLTVASDFSVTVSETSNYSTNIPEHDTESDGAQCQLSHLCSTDNDCVRQLGYDYTCQSVTGLTTSWPQFDSSGAEVVGSTTKTLASIVGGSNGFSKRCVYRGRGAPCLPDLSQANSGSTFNGSALVGTLSCSPNNSCAPTSSARFNDRISRFGATPAAQNSAGITPTSDTVGLGARLLGRPLNYYGTTSAPSSASSPLSINNVRAVCAPGTDINSANTVYELNSRLPAVRTDSADKLFGVGTASTLSVNLKSLNACPVTNASGNFQHFNNTSITDSNYTALAISQNLSSNLLDLAPMTNQNVYSSTSGSPITAVGYQRNSCLRAPGASCFTDMECAPSNFVAGKAKTASLSSILNLAEDLYWQEDLVCGNSNFKYLSAGVLNPDYDIKNNVCCRETGKVTTVYTQTSASAYKWCDTATKQIRVAGVNIPINSSSRYSKVHAAYNQMTCDTNQISSTKKFAVAIDDASPVERMRQILGQFKTLDAINQKTCCTQNWVRSFASDNGGGHSFVKTKMQNIDKAMFRNISWRGENNTVAGVVDDPFECDPNNFTNVSCEVKSLTAAEQEKYLTWAGALELIGIPQVAVMTNDQVFQLVDNNQNDNSASRNPLEDSSGAPVQYNVATMGEDFTDASGNRYYSAASYSKFNMTAGKFKKVFSESEFNCCIPSGKEIPDATTADQCCTGNIANNTGVKRCCLPDFTDVTVYLNRYVSSEGNSLTDSAYDMSTGYIKDTAQVQLLAQQKNICCSGKLMTGVAISKLSIPLTGGTYKPPTTQTTTTRFNYRTDEVDNNTETGSIGTIFDAGVRWNNHVYCVPANFGN